jgi:hypothetical protein
MYERTLTLICRSEDNLYTMDYYQLCPKQKLVVDYNKSTDVMDGSNWNELAGEEASVWQDTDDSEDGSASSDERH